MENNTKLLSDEFLQTLVNESGIIGVRYDDFELELCEETLKFIYENEPELFSGLTVEEMKERLVCNIIYEPTRLFYLKD